jgi:hypothetical protein
VAALAADSGAALVAAGLAVVGSAGLAEAAPVAAVVEPVGSGIL